MGKFNDVTKQKMIIAMDVKGYEQDGSGLKFINHNDGGKVVTFKNYDELYDFICKNFGGKK